MGCLSRDLSRLSLDRSRPPSRNLSGLSLDRSRLSLLDRSCLSSLSCRSRDPFRPSLNLTRSSSLCLSRPFLGSSSLFSDRPGFSNKDFFLSVDRSLSLSLLPACSTNPSRPFPTSSPSDVPSFFLAFLCFFFSFFSFFSFFFFFFFFSSLTGTSVSSSELSDSLSENSVLYL